MKSKQSKVEIWKVKPRISAFRYTTARNQRRHSDIINLSHIIYSHKVSQSADGKIFF